MRHFVIGVALVLLGAVPVLAQDEPRVSLSTSVNYSVGTTAQARTRRSSTSRSRWA